MGKYWNKIKRGAKDVGVGGAFNVFFDPMGITGLSDNTISNGFGLDKDKPITPNQDLANYGGDSVTSQVLRESYQRGRLGGMAQVDRGINGMGLAGHMGVGLATQGRDASKVGMGTYQAGIGMSDYDRQLQFDAARMQREAASGQAPSQAQYLMQANADQIANQARGMASAARGGNSAAALRNAGANASQQSLAVGQQMGALRAQEMAQARGAYGDLSGQMRGQDLQQAGLGGQMAGLGFGAQNQGIGAAQAAGAGIAGIGQAREANYLGTLHDAVSGERDARVDLEMARLGQARADREARDKRQGAVLGAFGTVVGGLYGGAGGAAAGGQASNLAG